MKNWERQYDLFSNSDLDFSKNNLLQDILIEKKIIKTGKKK